VPSVLRWCRDVLRLPSIPRRIDAAEQTAAAFLERAARDSEAQRALMAELASELRCLRGGHQTLSEVQRALMAELANEMRCLRGDHQTLTEAQRALMAELANELRCLRGDHQTLTEAQRALMAELANELRCLRGGDQTLTDALVALTGRHQALIDALEALTGRHQALIDALEALTVAAHAAEADRRALGDRIESVAARTDDVARASAKALGIALTTFVDAQKQLLALVLEKDVDEGTSRGGPSPASGSTEVT
jgi:cytochrome c-type biogenesis protein CcmH/NrfF